MARTIPSSTLRLVLFRCLMTLWASLFAAVVVLDSADAQQPATPAQNQNATQPAPTPQAPAPKGSDQAPLAPAEKVLPELSTAQARITDAVDRAEKTIDRVRHDEKELSVIRDELDKLIGSIDENAEAVAPQITTINDQLSRLGPPPPTDAPEAEEIARERQRLQELATRFGTIERSGNLAQTRATQLIARIRALRQAIFAKNLLQRDTTPLSARFWSSFRQDLPATVRQFQSIGADWWDSLQSRALELLLLGPIVLLSVLLLVLFRVRIMRKLMPDHGPTPPFYLRAKAAILSVPILALPLTMAALLAYFTINALSLAPDYMEEVLHTTLFAILLFILIHTLANAILTPSRTNWRLVDIPPKAARRISILVQISAAAFLIDIVVSQAVSTLYLAPPIAIALRFLTNIAAALPLVAIVFTPFAAPTSQAALSTPLQPLWLKPPLLAATMTVLALSGAGYLALGHFVLSQLHLIAGILAFVLIFHSAVSSYLSRPVPAIGQGDGDSPGLAPSDIAKAEQRKRLTNRAISIGIDMLLVLAAVPAVLLTWGFSTAELQAGARAALFGFEIGEFRISLARIFLAIALFAGVLFLTRMAQRAMTTWLQSASTSEAAVGNSIQAFLGYAGFVLAVLAGLSYAGFDITNIAIVAGALSVGIGFGLQSIVNNFVSGLILLFERPVKVGDWVVVNGNEGHIRRISVRSTEIETFDRSSIIVPNSEFITGAVTNWTHRNALGRGIIKVGVSYDADPEHVRDVLLGVAHKSKLVLAHPAPFVAFDDFGPSSLDFSLRIYLADVNQRLSALSELRIEVFKALKAANIAIPFPQSDIHIRDLDPVRELLATIARQRNERSEREPKASD